MREVRREERGGGRGRCSRGGCGRVLMPAAPDRGVKARWYPGDASEGGETAEVCRSRSDGRRAGRGVMLKILDVHQSALVVLLDVVRFRASRARLAVRAAPRRLRTGVLMAADDPGRRGAAHRRLRRDSAVGGVHAIVHAPAARSSARRLDAAGEVDRLGIPRRSSGVRGVVRGGAVCQSGLRLVQAGRRREISRCFQIAGILLQRRVHGDARLLSNRRVRDNRRRSGRR